MSINENYRLIINYLFENKDAFTDSERNIIISYITSHDNRFSIPNIVLQLYDDLGILPENLNPYKAFTEFLESIHDIKDKHIVEIGGGNIPVLAKRISCMQDKGTITVYDPNIYLKKKDYPNMKLIKRNFYPISNVDNADILIGLLPCGASGTIVKSAVRHKKDFMIALCDDCNYLEFYDSYNDEDRTLSFIDQTRKAVEDNNLGKLKVKYIKEIGDNNPVIYNVRG